MRGAIPPLPHTSPWRGAFLSTGTTLPLSYHTYFTSSIRMCVMPLLNKINESQGCCVRPLAPSASEL